MVKSLHKSLVLGFCLMALNGCTDNGFLFRSFGYDKEEPQSYYIIGESYQIKEEWYTPKEDYSYSATGVASWYQGDPDKLTANGEKYDENALTAMHKTLPIPSIVRITNLDNGNTAIVRVNDRGPYVNNRLMDVSQKAAEQLEMSMTGTTMIKVELLPVESKHLKSQILAKNGGQMEEENVSGASVLTSQVKIESLSDQPKPVYQPDDSAITLYDGSEKSMNAKVQPKETSAPVKSIEMEPVKIVENQPPLVNPISGDYIQAGAFSNIDNARKLQTELNRFGPAQIYDTSSSGTVLHRVRMGPFESRESAAQTLDKLKKAGYGNAKIIFEP